MEKLRDKIKRLICKTQSPKEVTLLEGINLCIGKTNVLPTVLYSNSLAESKTLQFTSIINYKDIKENYSGVIAAKFKEEYGIELKSELVNVCYEHLEMEVVRKVIKTVKEIDITLDELLKTISNKEILICSSELGALLMDKFEFKPLTEPLIQTTNFHSVGTFNKTLLIVNPYLPAQCCSSLNKELFNYTVGEELSPGKEDKLYVTVNYNPNIINYVVSDFTDKFMF
jgi:hypothetical protein